MDLKLPDLGEGVMEGEIVKWHVKPGDSVKEDQVVLEIMTDKATVEIPTKASGVVSELVFKEGETAKVGQVMMRLEGSAGSAKAAPAPAKAAAPAPAAAKAAAPAPAKAAATTAAPARIVNNDPQAAPAVRKLAREKGVELGTIRGSGPNGRILLEDVASGGSSGGARTAQTFSQGGTRGQRTEERVPVRGLRRKIAEKMAQSMHTVANFSYVEECDVTELVEFRTALKPEASRRNTKITFLPFIAKAVAIGLKEFPQLNAQLLEENGHPTEIIYKKYYNIGIAVDTEDGLTVPVIKDVDCKGLWELSAEIIELGNKARDKKLAVHDLQEGTFTISNAGNIGGLFAPPIINYPEVAIMGVHQIKKRPMVIGNDIRIRDMLHLSLSLDHRVVDGAVAARFMNRVVALLQDPKMLLMEMMGENF